MIKTIGLCELRLESYHYCLHHFIWPCQVPQKLSPLPCPIRTGSPSLNPPTPSPPLSLAQTNLLLISLAFTNRLFISCRGLMMFPLILCTFLSGLPTFFFAHRKKGGRHKKKIMSNNWKHFFLQLLQYDSMFLDDYEYYLLAYWLPSPFHSINVMLIFNFLFADFHIMLSKTPIT